MNRVFKILRSSSRLYTTPSLQSNPKIDSIIDSITHLNLLETSELVSQLKTRLKLSDIAAPIAQPTSSPLVQESIKQEPIKEKTSFIIKLEQFDAASKAKVIREIKTLMPGSNLVEAKKFVESVPKVIRENVPKEEAEKIKKALEAVGATVILE